MKIKRILFIVALSILLVGLVVVFIWNRHGESTNPTDNNRNVTNPPTFEPLKLITVENKDLKFSFGYPNKIILSDGYEIKIRQPVEEDANALKNYELPTSYTIFFYTSSDYAPINFTIRQRRPAPKNMSLIEYEKIIYQESAEELKKVSVNEFKNTFEETKFKGYTAVKMLYITNGKVTGTRFFIEKAHYIYEFYYAVVGNDYLNDEVMQAFFVNLKLGD